MRIIDTKNTIVSNRQTSSCSDIKCLKIPFVQSGLLKGENKDILAPLCLYSKTALYRVFNGKLYFELALTNRNRQVRLFKVGFEILRFGKFHEMHTVRHLLSNLGTSLVPYWILDYFEFWIIGNFRSHFQAILSNKPWDE